MAITRKSIIRRLLNVAVDHYVEVRQRKCQVEGDGYLYIFRRRCQSIGYISLCMANDWYSVQTLAHELGHVIDYERNYVRFSLSGEVARERRAWSNARRLLRSAGYDRWVEFDTDRNECLKEYEEQYGTEQPE